MSKKPWCCVIGCEADAEWDIYGETYSLDDYTQACTEHVGEMLLDGWNHIEPVEAVS